MQMILTNYAEETLCAPFLLTFSNSTNLLNHLRLEKYLSKFMYKSGIHKPGQKGLWKTCHQSP